MAGARHPPCVLVFGVHLSVIFCCIARVYLNLSGNLTEGNVFASRVLFNLKFD